MDKNKMIIIALLMIIVAISAGIFASMYNLNRDDANLSFESNSTVSEGDYIKILLSGADGNPLASQTVNITITDESQSNSYYSVVTNDYGIGMLRLDKNPGNYTVKSKFNGNDNFNGAEAFQNLTVKKKVAEAETTYDPGAFYSAQAGRVIYTGEIHDAPDGHKWKHLGYNEWVKID